MRNTETVYITTITCDMCSKVSEAEDVFIVPIYKSENNHGYSGHYAYAVNIDICRQCAGKPILTLLDIIKEKTRQ